MSLNDAANLGTVGALFLGIITLGMLAYQLRQQRKSRDFQTCIEMQRELHVAWENLRRKHEDSEDWTFYFGQLMSVYETACYFINENVIDKSSQKLLVNHVVEIVSALIDDEDILKEIRAIASSEETYSEIKKFLRRNKHLLGDDFDRVYDAFKF